MAFSNKKQQGSNGSEGVQSAPVKAKKKNEMCTEKYTALGYEVHAVFSKEKDINEDLQKMGG